MSSITKVTSSSGGKSASIVASWCSAAVESGSVGTGPTGVVSAMIKFKSQSELARWMLT